MYITSNGFLSYCMIRTSSQIITVIDLASQLTYIYFNFCSVLHQEAAIPMLSSYLFPYISPFTDLFRRSYSSFQNSLPLSFNCLSHSLLLFLILSTFFPFRTTHVSELNISLQKSSKSVLFMSDESPDSGQGLRDGPGRSFKCRH